MRCQIIRKSRNKKQIFLRIYAFLILPWRQEMKRTLNYLATATLSLMLMAMFANAQSLPAGNDFWSTTSNNTYDDLNLPAGAIGAGSDPYQGRVFLKGDPADGNPYDTSIRRQNSVTPPGNTSLKVVELRMVSVAPFDVSFNNGSETRSCTMSVTISPSQNSTGSMNIGNNGTFSSNLNVIPQLDFDCEGGPGFRAERTKTTLDMGSPLIQAVMRKQAASAQKKISAGIATTADIAAAQACAQPKATRKTVATRTAETNVIPTRRAPAGCGIRFTMSGTWTTCGGLFCIPDPFLVELALLAQHGITPVWLGPGPGPGQTQQVP